MTSEVKLLGLVQGWSFQEKKGSAFYQLFNELSESGYLAGLADFEIPSLIRKGLFLSNFSLNRERWNVKDQLDVRRYGLASRYADSAVSNTVADFNSIIQIGSNFSLTDSLFGGKNIPKFSFHDNNCVSYFKYLPKRIVKDKRISSVFEYESRVYRDLSSIFTMSRTLRDSFIKDFGFPEDKVVYAGFGAPFGIRDIACKSYQSKNILFVASHSFESKGGKDLVTAFRKSRKKIPDLTLTMVGKDWGIDEPGITCLGFLDKRNPADFERYRKCFEHASLFVLPSHKEAFGEVFIEAMSYGVPCIGARTGVMPELIEGNAAGYVVNPGDIDHLTSLICDLVESECDLKKMGGNGIFAVDSEYQWSTVTSRIVSQVKKFI